MIVSWTISQLRAFLLDKATGGPRNYDKYRSFDVARKRFNRARYSKSE
jgi:hypothetical protein